MSHKMLKWTLLFIVITTILTIQAIPVVDEKELEKVQSCKTLCGHCGCTGFYCGDECICECNNQEDEDITCVSLMKSNCQKLKLPFEVLIQGPSGNRFVRDLIETDPEHKPIDRKTRSTLSIYKPVDDEEKIENFLTNNKLQIKINKQHQQQYGEDQSAVDHPTPVEHDDNNKVDEQKLADIVNTQLSLNNDAIEYENKDSTFVFESIDQLNRKNMEHQRPKQIIDEFGHNNKEFEYNQMQKRQAPEEEKEQIVGQAADEVVGAAAPSEQVAASPANDQVGMIKKENLFDKIKLKEKFLTMHKKLELAKPLELKKPMALKEIALSKKPLKLKLDAEKLKLLGMEKKLVFDKKMLGAKKKLGHEKFLLGKPLKFGGDKIVGDAAVVGAAADTLVGAPKSDDNIIVQPAHTQ